MAISGFNSGEGSALYAANALGLGIQGGVGEPLKSGTKRNGRKSMAVGGHGLAGDPSGDRYAAVRGRSRADDNFFLRSRCRATQWFLNVGRHGEVGGGLG